MSIQTYTWQKHNNGEESGGRGLGSVAYRALTVHGTILCEKTEKV